MQYSKSSGNRSRYLQIVVAIAVIAAIPLGWAQAEENVAQTTAAQPAKAGTLERIRTTGKFVLGYYLHGYPMSYRDQSGRAAGYSVTLCQKVADHVKSELGLQKLAVEWVPLTPETGMQSVQQGKIDLLCGSDAASFTNRGKVSFSLPVFPGGISVLLRADAPKSLQNLLEERPAPYRPIWRASPSSPIQHKTIAVVAGTPAVKWSMERASKLRIIGKLETVDSYDTGVTKVLRRDVDMLFGDRAVLLAQAKRSPDASKLRVLTRHFTYEPLALALARNDDDFRLAVDRGLSRFIASSTFGEAFRATFGMPDADSIEYFRWTPQ